MTFLPGLSHGFAGLQHATLERADLPPMLRTACAGYSVARRLTPDTTHTTAAFRAVRAADDAEADIGFTHDGRLDEAALLAFASGGAVLIKTYYDAFSGWHATQTDKSLMHQIVDHSGNIIRENGLPAARATSASGAYELPPNALSVARSKSYFGVFAVFRPTTEAIVRPIFYASTNATATSPRVFALASATDNRIGIVFRNNADTEATKTNIPPLSYGDVHVQATAYVSLLNGISEARVHRESNRQDFDLSTGNFDDSPSAAVALWGRSAKSSLQSFRGSCQECIVFNEEISAIEALEENQVDHYFTPLLGAYGFDSAVAANASVATEGWRYGLTSWAAAITAGGRGGEIIRVTNTNDSGAGSLRDALLAAGPRIVVFEIGGVIELQSNIAITSGMLTVAGQTAPSPGITVINGQVNVAADDVRIQHIRVRPGDNGLPKRAGLERDAFTTTNARRVIFSHCSATWATDEGLSISGNPFLGGSLAEWQANQSGDCVIEKCIIAENLYDSTHSKGPHSRGSLINDNVQNAYIFGSLYASNGRRSPAALKGGSISALVNNYIVNPGSGANLPQGHSTEWGTSTVGTIEFDYIGNVCIRATDTTAIAATIALGDAKVVAYFEDNFTPAMELCKDWSKDKGLTLSETKRLWSTQDSLPTNQVVSYVCANAGARPWDRDAPDTRIVQQAIDRRTRIINSQSEVDGYPGAATASTRAFDPMNWDLDTMTPIGPDFHQD